MVQLQQIDNLVTYLQFTHRECAVYVCVFRLSYLNALVEGHWTCSCSWYYIDILPLIEESFSVLNLQQLEIQLALIKAHKTTMACMTENLHRLPFQQSYVVSPTNDATNILILQPSGLEIHLVSRNSWLKVLLEIKVKISFQKQPDLH